MSSRVDDFLNSVLEGIAPVTLSHLPKECLADSCHVVQLRGVFDPRTTDTDSEAFAVLQVNSMHALPSPSHS